VGVHLRLDGCRGELLLLLLLRCCVLRLKVPR
jgi:hypothetical protein